MRSPRTCATIRPAPSGGMDWWRMEWPFSRVRKIFFRGRIFQENPCNSAERAIFAKFQAPKFENSEPEKLQFHTPSHSIPPLDSLLTMGLVRGEHPNFEKDAPRTWAEILASNQFRESLRELLRENRVDTFISATDRHPL